MTFKPEVFYQLAVHLNENIYFDFLKDTAMLQAIMRTTISRIYYALLLETAKINDVFSGGSGFHDTVINSVVNKDSRKEFWDMKELREKADYEIYKTVTIDDVNDQFDMFEININKIT